MGSHAPQSTQASREALTADVVDRAVYDISVVGELGAVGLAEADRPAREGRRRYASAFSTASCQEQP